MHSSGPELNISARNGPKFSAAEVSLLTEPLLCELALLKSVCLKIVGGPSGAVANIPPGCKQLTADFAASICYLYYYGACKASASSALICLLFARQLCVSMGLADAAGVGCHT